MPRSQPALGVGQGQGEGSTRGAGIVVAVRQRHRGLARRGRAGGERQADVAAGREPDALAQADDGIQDDPGRARQRIAVERERILGAAAAPEEARPVGLPLERPLGPALERQDVDRPDRRLVAARPAVAQERPALGQELGLDEELGEGRVGQVVGRRGEHDLGVAGHLELARPVAEVGHGQAAHLDVVLGRDRDVELGGDVLVAAAGGFAVLVPYHSARKGLLFKSRVDYSQVGNRLVARGSLRCRASG